MKISKMKDGENLYVSIEGALDITTSPQLKASLEEDLDSVKNVFFDLRGTDYTSSSGLRVLLGAFQTLEKKGGRMVLKNVNQSFLDILEMTGFTDFIEIDNSEGAV